MAIGECSGIPDRSYRDTSRELGCRNTEQVRIETMSMNELDSLASNIPRQSILAAKAGAKYVSPFIGRVDDTGWDGMDLVHQLRQIFSIQGYKTEILAASIRNPNHIIKCAELCSDVCSFPLDSIL